MANQSEKEKLARIKELFEVYEKADSHIPLHEYISEEDLLWLRETAVPLFEKESNNARSLFPAGVATKWNDFLQKLMVKEKEAPSAKNEKHAIQEQEDSNEDPMKRLERIKKWFTALQQKETEKKLDQFLTADDVLWLEQIAKPRFEKSREVQPEVREVQPKEPMQPEQSTQPEPDPASDDNRWEELQTSFDQLRKDKKQENVQSLDHYFKPEDIGWLIGQAEKAIQEKEKEATASKKHWYEMTKRNVDVGNQPKGFVECVVDREGENDLVAYNRKLSKKELAKFDLRPCQGPVLTQSKKKQQEPELERA